MATPGELAQIVEYCEHRWPGTRNYRDYGETVHDFTNIPAAALREAAQDHYHSGARTAPALSELRKAAVAISHQRGLNDPNSTSCEVRGDHSRSWAVTPIGDGKKREAQCLDCGTVLIRPADQLPTVGEAEDREKGSRLEAPDDEMTQRIAP